MVLLCSESSMLFLIVVCDDRDRGFALVLSYIPVNTAADGASMQGIRYGMYGTYVSIYTSTLSISLGFIFANANDDILRLLRLTGKVVFKNTLYAIGITFLGIEGRARVVWYHAVATV